MARCRLGALLLATATLAMVSLAPAASGDARPSAWAAMMQSQQCEPRGTALAVTAENNVFDTDCLAAPASAPFRIRLVNRDRFAHNLSIYEARGGDPLFIGDYVLGGQTATYNVPAQAEGTWYFRCDIHPQMEGTFIVGEGGGTASPTGSPTPATGRAPEGPVVRLEPVAEGLTAPVFVTFPPDDTGRLFIVDQIGLIRVVANGELLETPYLDVRDKLVELNPQYDERGLLGLAFHPEYRDNGRVFVYYTAPLRPTAPRGYNSTATLSEFKVSSNPDFADKASEKILLQIDDPQANHNGGHMAFGPDGKLYFPFGDGGMANDVGLGHSPQGNAQDPTNIFGDILRFDVDAPGGFGIPSDNPFVGPNDGARDEIWALGFRNPYHISFDAENGDLYASDAGQDRFEEVSLVEKGGNYGWRIKEGSHCFDPEHPSMPPPSCPNTGALGKPLIDPVIEYSREEILGSVVVGGYVYRGDAVPYLRGLYVFGDYSRDRVRPDGVLFAATPDSGKPWKMVELRAQIRDQGAAPSPAATATREGDLMRFVLGFGEDESRELYLGVVEVGGPTGTTGTVYRFAAVPDQEPPADADVGGSPWIWIVIGAVGALVLLGLLTMRGRTATR